MLVAPTFRFFLVPFAAFLFENLQASYRLFVDRIVCYGKMLGVEVELKDGFEQSAGLGVRPLMLQFEDWAPGATLDYGRVPPA